MGFVEERQNIENHWAANWTQTPTRYEQPSASFTQPGTQNVARQPWVALYIRNTSSQRASIGTSPVVHRHTGLIIVQVFTDLGIGTNPGRTLADAVTEIWRDRTLTFNQYAGGENEYLVCGEPALNQIGDDGHSWFQINVTTPYRRDDIF